MNKLESLKKKRIDWTEKIEKMEERIAKLKSLGYSDEKMIIRLDKQWVEIAKRRRSELDAKIRTEELYRP